MNPYPVAPVVVSCVPRRVPWVVGHQAVPVGPVPREEEQSFRRDGRWTNLLVPWVHWERVMVPALDCPLDARDAALVAAASVVRQFQVASCPSCTFYWVAVHLRDFRRVYRKCNRYH